MDEKSKKEAWKIFYVAAFLFITIFFVLPYLAQVSVYFHERAHLKTLNKYGVEARYEFNLLESIPNFFFSKESFGVTKFNSKQYSELSKSQKFEVYTSGIISDLKFLFLIGIYLSFINLYLFYKIKIVKKADVLWALAINWILFMWLIFLIVTTLANVSHVYGDIYQLVLDTLS